MNNINQQPPKMASEENFVFDKKNTAAIIAIVISPYIIVPSAMVGITERLNGKSILPTYKKIAPKLFGMLLKNSIGVAPFEVCMALLRAKNNSSMVDIQRIKYWTLLFENSFSLLQNLISTK